MSNSKKITDLAAYTDSQVQSNDLLFITDIAAQETKKITAIDIADYAFNAKSASIFNGNYIGSFTGSFSGSFTGNLTGTSSWATNALVADSVSGGTGEINTASDTGSYGYGLVSNKVGVDLRFKKLGQGTNIQIITDSSDNNVLLISALSTTTSPGGATGNVQFNSNAGTFGGNSNLSWDTTNNNKLTVVGNVSSTTFSSSVTNAVGYFGTASFSVSSSNALSSSYSLSASYSLSSSHATYAASAAGTLGGSGFAGLDSSIFQSSVSPLTLNSYLNSYYFINHGFGSSPSLVRVTLICQVSDSLYIANDEISVEQLHDDTGDADDERPISTIWSNTTAAAVSWASPSGVYAHNKTGGRISIDPTKWKIKIRTWK